MLDCNSTKIPMHPKEIISKDKGGTPVDHTNLSWCGKQIFGEAYNYAFECSKTYLRYVKGTMEFGFIYTKDDENNEVIGYSDSDLAGNVEDMISTGGMVFYLNKSLITWNSQKQRCVSLSSCEAEFMAAKIVSCQAIWLRKFLSQITGIYIQPVILFIDNKSAIDLAKNPVFHDRSKHIDIRFHFIRECIENGDIVVKHVCTKEQRADSLTKALSAIRFERMRSLLGVHKCVKTSLD